MKLKISINTEPIEFYILGKLHIAPVMVLGHYILRFQFLAHRDGFEPFF